MAFVLFFCFHLALAKDLFTCSDTLCLSHWIGDGTCDLRCMIPACNYDSSYVGSTLNETFLLSDCYNDCNCNKEMLANNQCDSECDNIECGWDLGDCGYCASGCFESDLTGSECKENCNRIECLHNNNNCGWCSEGCFDEDLLGDTCKLECNNSICNLFYPNACSEGLCAKGCSQIMIEDERCDFECFNSECQYDLGQCYCNQGCEGTSESCKSDLNSLEVCDNKECLYKDGECGYCASGCYESDLGDGTCQDQCNNPDCNYDYGDCGCSPNCSFIYNTSLSNFTQIGATDECSVSCLVPECHFAVDFCADKNIVKKGVINYIIHKNASILLNLDNCSCSSDLIEKYLDGTEYCEMESDCNSKECLYCMGKATKVMENCVRNSFDQCLVCESTMVDGTCQDTLTDCPTGYESKGKLSELFQNNVWCLREPVHYSSFYYMQVYVDPSASNAGSGTKENPYSSLYNTLINVYASYTKIFITGQEIDFRQDDSTSIFIPDKYDPLNSNSKHTTQELWMIGDYSESIKTKVYWKQNLKLTPLSKKFYLKNLEFVGNYLLKNDCNSKFCLYCPYLSKKGDYYLDDRSNLLNKETVYKNYSTTCSTYSTLNVLDFTKEVYIEDVSFAGFRYQYNSFIRSSGVLNMKNVNFSSMQAKAEGSIILLDCSSDCINSVFYYNEGKVSDIGAGYDDTHKVATGSFILSLNFGFISISNVTFSYNFMLVYQLSENKAYLLYCKNNIGTLSISDCKFTNNYVNYLVYIDMSSLVYSGYRIELDKA